MSTNENNQVSITGPRPCTRCKGEGRTHSQWAVENGYETAEGKPCTRCNGTGQFEGLDVGAIIDALFTTKGKKAFRKAFPAKMDHYKGGFAARVYYVWRLTRFHGGRDVTMPMTADMVIGGDPFQKELDALAGLVAKKVFGTDMAAAYRWGILLGFHKGEVPAGLPETAYEGPVADEFKPAFEAPELR